MHVLVIRYANWGAIRFGSAATPGLTKMAIPTPAVGGSIFSSRGSFAIHYHT